MIHNDVIERENFYISYNFGDVGIYGSTTTAIVIGQMQRFYILKGDHRKQLEKCGSFENAMIYYSSRPKDEVHRFSNVYKVDDAEKVITDYQKFLKEIK